MKMFFSYDFVGAVNKMTIVCLIKLLLFLICYAERRTFFYANVVTFFMQTLPKILLLYPWLTCCNCY